MTAPETTGSLRGLRVLDLSRILAGPLCAQMLADHGAEVIKVEPPAGDDTRAWGPPFVTGTMSAYHSAINRNKSNACLDLTSPEGQRVLGELLADADVLVENFKAGTLAKWGFSDDVLTERFPGLVRCRITGFGTDGPMGGTPGYDAILQAYGGLMSINGERTGPPLRMGVPIVDMVTGIYAFSGILLALHDRHRTGRGQLVDCTLLDTAISLLHPHSSAWLVSGEIPQRTGSAHPSIAPYDTFEAADGPIFISGGNDRMFRNLVAVLGIPDLAEDSRFTGNADRVHHVEELRALLAEPISARTRHDLARALLERGVPATPVHDVGEALTDPQVRHRDMVVDHEGHRGVGIPIKLDRTPGNVRTEPRERGADTRRILASLGYSDAEISALIAADAALTSEDAAT
ncbi:CaiB/BaiF CoA-transferase family protein [Saccharopolyspora sp. TS4A08]|uniref:CaiB/BaiF CoA-transferase family protein n=1 Tax=Saccharopolyspora ipomoeae TaxID=3042027 RepID=A0ABT6PR26_9PSEU|nr:CaiB/BaiF CoA-transferase family protein [Saccharopolyspora sp. TS4A08]MDI2030466.1 CaiB/BaiF CoA-transferase family protein [Saccharopolyspora sp. TS4A08]